MPTQKTQGRLPREIRSAVACGEGYEALKTYVQFLKEESEALETRIVLFETRIADFRKRGGRVFERTDGSVSTTVLTLGPVVYTIEYTDRGRIRRYSVENPAEDSESSLELHRLFFVYYLMPRFRKRLEEVRMEIAALENDTLISGIAEVAGMIRGDKYLTATSLSGFGIQSDEDFDPFGLMEER